MYQSWSFIFWVDVIFQTTLLNNIEYLLFTIFLLICLILINITFVLLARLEISKFPNK